jgi:RNA polymerase sigma factor (sigma-70 family)
MSQADAINTYATTRDAEAFAQLVNEYQRLVFATCRRKLHDQADLEDAVQETFLKLAQRAGELRSNVGGWLHRCAVNVAIDLNRRRQRRAKYESQVAARANSSSNDPQQMLAEVREQIDQAMDKLDDDQRELIIQRYFVGRPQVELAQEANVAPSTITHRLDRAIDSLRKHLQALGCGTAMAGGAAALGGLLEAETASAAVPAALTANVMKIGLSGVTSAVAAGGTMAVGTMLASIAAGIVVLAGVAGVVIYTVKTKSQTNITTVQTPVTPAPGPIQPAPAAVTAAAQAPQPPQWDVAAQPTKLKAILSGRVLDRAGNPVPRAVVQILGPAGQTQSTSDDQGNYAFTTIRRDGEYRIGVDAPGYVSIEPYVNQIPSVQLTATSEARRDLVLERGVPITVVVKNFTGQPVRNVRIDANIPDQRMSSNRYLRTDNDGVVKFVLAPSKQTYTVAAIVDGYAPEHTTITPDDVEKPVEVELTVAPGLTVNGVAMCKDGKPATGWSIVAYPDWWASNYVPKGAPIDAQGNFALKDVTPGSYRLMISIPQGDMSTSESLTTMTLPLEGQKPLALNINRQSPGSLAKFEGKVKFVGGPAESVWVQMQSLSDNGLYYHVNIETGRSRRDNARLPRDEGRFFIDGVTPGEYRLTFESTTIESKVMERVKVPGELPVIELKIVGKPHITGTIVNAQTGQPVPHFAVRAKKNEHIGNGPSFVQDANWVQVSNPQGKFDLELVGPGKYQVQVSAEGLAWGWSDTVTIEKGGQSNDATIRLISGGSISGSVVDLTGKPVSGAKVIPLSMAKTIAGHGEERFESEAGHVISDAQGQFTIPHLASGSETVRVVHSDFAPATVSGLDVKLDETTSIGRITLSAGASVEGTVYDNTGKPAPGVALHFQDASGYSGNDEQAGRLASVVSDEKGYFKVTHLPSQMLWVTVGNPWERQGVARRIVLPIDGKTTRLDFGGTVPVTGRLIVDDKPVSNSRVQLAQTSAYQGPVLVNTSTDDQGRFTFMGPPIGKYTLFREGDPRRGGFTRVRDLEFTGAPLNLEDSAADTADVTITLEADDPKDLKGIRYVAIQTAIANRVWQETVGVCQVDPSEPNTWRAAGIPTGTFRVIAQDEKNICTSTRLERDASKRSLAVRLRIPRCTATLNISINSPETAGGGVSGLLVEGDQGVQSWVGFDKSTTISLNLPPGNYRVLNSNTRSPLKGGESIELKDGAACDVKLDAATDPALTFVQIRLFDSNGIPIMDSSAKLIDESGKTIESNNPSDIGLLYILKPGNYRAVVNRGGKTVEKPVVVHSPAAPGTARRADSIDLVLD